MTTDTIGSAISDYWSASAPRFDTRASHTAQPDAWRDVLAAAFQADGPKNVIDLGTGTGACAIIAAGLGHRVRAYDGSAGMLATARQAAEAAGVTVSFHQALILEAAIDPQSADIVTLRNVLWTVADPLAVLRKAHGALRPGGRIVLSDGLWSAGPNYRATYADEIVGRLPLHGGLTEEGARGLLAEAGFGPASTWQHLFPASPYPGDIPMFVLTASA